jgi:hypothetical protein
MIYLNFIQYNQINITNKGGAIAIPELIGVFPNPEDVSIQGRYNTDITQK